MATGALVPNWLGPRPGDRVAAVPGGYIWRKTMQDQHSPQPESNDSYIDPSIWRGMTQRRMSRRQMLRAAGTGAGALGVSAFLAACGVKGATVGGGSTPKPGGVGSPSWWAKQ